MSVGKDNQDSMRTKLDFRCFGRLVKMEWSRVDIHIDVDFPHDHPSFKVFCMPNRFLTMSSLIYSHLTIETEFLSVHAICLGERISMKCRNGKITSIQKEK
jgi:hypothetical protein